MINSFIVDYSLICVLGFVDLEVDFDFLFVLVGCIYIIYWYKGINCIYIFIYISVMVMYIYMLLVGIGLAGNYYCIIESSCCLQWEKSDVVVLDLLMEVYVIGLCYCCNCEMVILNGIVLYFIFGFNCIY